MKKIPYVLTLLFIQSAVAQDPGYYSSGLLYSDTAIIKLSQIVDSLHQKFEQLPTKVYYSSPRGKAHFVKLEKNLESAQKDLQNNMSYADFIKKHPHAKEDKGIFILTKKHGYITGEQKEFPSINITKKHQNLQGKWIFERFSEHKYRKERKGAIVAYYITEEPQERMIPERYHKMIHYADFMNPDGSYWRNRRENVYRSAAEIGGFTSYIATETGRPAYNAPLSKWQYWDSIRYVIIEEQLLHQEKFKTLLNKAVNAAMSGGHTGDEFEEYVYRYHSREAALECKRNRYVISECTQDGRYHEMNIAVLAAETANWDIFLPHHLSIISMNKKRIGEFKWDNKRWKKSYVRELELIGLNTHYLLLGGAIGTTDTWDRTYPKVMAQSEYATEIGDNILAMLADEELNDSNRFNMYRLFRDYNMHIEDQNKKKENLIRLKEIVVRLPRHLKRHMKVYIF